LSQCIYPNITQDYKNQQWLSERAILVAKKVDVNAININIQNVLPGENSTYKSVNYPTEFT